MSLEYDEPVIALIPDDIRKLAKNGVINSSLTIKGEAIRQLNQVKQIRGSLGINDTILETLGELEEIAGNLWISYYNLPPKLKSLGNVIRVGGDVSLRYSSIDDLGDLEHVTGKVSLRDTKIESLGKIKFIGGDLHLPKRLQGRIDFSEIVVKGKIRYWNDSKTPKNVKNKDELGLVKSKITIPFWRHFYIFSYSAIDGATFQQREFYKYFRGQFFNETYIDLEGNDNYCFVLLFDILEEFRKDGDLVRLEILYKQFSSHYPVAERYLKDEIIKEHSRRGDFETAWVMTLENQYVSADQLCKFERKLKKTLLNGDLMARLSGFSHLTSFGQKNIDKIKPYATDLLLDWERINERRFLSRFVEMTGLERCYIPHDEKFYPDYYKQFYISEKEFELYKQIDIGRPDAVVEGWLPHVVEKAIFNQCRLLLIKAEDMYRENLGMPKIGEGWISETELFYLIKSTFAEHEVKQHGRPKWLGRQHLDIYFPELNIAIEYQGAQHYRAIDFFGGEEALRKTMERDEQKRAKCLANNCILIHVEESYKYSDVESAIRQAILQKIN